VDAPVRDLAASAYTIPTDGPEADGTLSWDATTVVAVRVEVAGATGLGFTYGPAACATLIGELLRDRVVGSDPMDVPRTHGEMVRVVRNAGRPGVASMAIAAVDVALWDVKAKLLGLPLHRLLGAVRDDVPVYGSGGFTSYDDGRLAEQLEGWVRGLGIPRVKIKIGESWGRGEERDLRRVALARRVVGADAELFVDANGAYGHKQAVRVARRLEEHDVRWFEEPVSSDDLSGLRHVRAATGVDVAAGEYGYDLGYFRRMAAAEAVDVLQVDASRCAGLTEWFRAAAVAAAFGLDVSAHTAPSLHLHAACATPNLRHVEYFHDHARIERLLFDGARAPEGGVLRPDPSRPGLGLELKASDAEPYRIAA
jgi:L-alanine-DL-glutamate epimerase-like enolase superfamily enzyme